ncbi:hypothetical protein C8R47DRAFT_1080328 [Mycena vitilis]|nr:hypothetical protein C8R47DRAFT_1080328 [Mycena vitilis]
MSAAAPWAFPLELVLEIASYHRDSYDFLAPLVQYDDAEEHCVSREVLRSLSQTSSTLRTLCLPFLWEKFDVPLCNLQYRISNRAPDEDSAVAHILPYIKQVSAAGPKLSAHISFEAWGTTALDPSFLLIDFLYQLTNLTSLRIYNLPDSEQVMWDIDYAFGLASFPAITSLHVPYRLGRAFYAFHNVKTFAAPTIPAGSFLGRLKMPSLQFPHMRVLSISSPLEIKHGVINPSLPRPHVVNTMQSHLELLNAFTRLRELALVYEKSEGFLPLDALIEGGKKVSMVSQSTETKVLKFWSGDSYHIIHVQRCAWSVLMARAGMCWPSAGCKYLLVRIT